MSSTTINEADLWCWLLKWATSMKEVSLVPATEVGRDSKRNPIFSVDCLSGPNPLMHGLLRRARPTRAASYLKFIFIFLWILFSILFDGFCLNLFFNFIWVLFSMSFSILFDEYHLNFFNFVWILFSTLFSISFESLLLFSISFSIHSNTRQDK
jgi:hypothetical protein